MERRDELGQTLVRTLRALRVADDREARSLLRKEVAHLLVDLRETFSTHSGEPDWAGRSHEYREYVRERYVDAGYDRELARETRNAVAYHVSAALRERLTADEISSLGLRAPTVAERHTGQRAARAALLRTLAEPADNPDLERTIAAAWSLLRSVSPAAVAALDPRARAGAAVLLGRVAEQAAALLNATQHAPVTE